MRFLLIGLMVFTSLSCKERESDLKEAPTGDSRPMWFGLETERYDALPLEAQLDSMPWPGDYWATLHGGIGYRWNETIKIADDERDDYRAWLKKLPILKPDTYRRMKSKRIERLSPAEKYDLWVGRKDLEYRPEQGTNQSSATALERSYVHALAARNGGTIQSWEGICNGWSLAAITEPAAKNPVRVKDPKGREILFYPGDIKALLSRLYFDYQPHVNIARLGSACFEVDPTTDANGRVTNLDCRDINPMAFHLALGGYIAKNKGFVFDQNNIQSVAEIWNQPVYGYKIKSMSEPRPVDKSYTHAAPNTVSLVDVSVDLKFIVEAAPQQKPLTSEELLDYIDTKTYHYTLEVDDKGLILGGEWKKNSEIPDFMWKANQPISDDLFDKSYPISYSKVRELLELSIK
jgi:hypothetical protein